MLEGIGFGWAPIGPAVNFNSSFSKHDVQPKTGYFWYFSRVRIYRTTLRFLRPFSRSALSFGSPSAAVGTWCTRSLQGWDPTLGCAQSRPCFHGAHSQSSF